MCPDSSVGGSAAVSHTLTRSTIGEEKTQMFNRLNCVGVGMQESPPPTPEQTPPTDNGPSASVEGGERRPLDDKNKTDPGVLAKSLNP
ncbi:hypothetical protein T265_02242 [Opisthorchis viverrini]|uniref:Uncharacterized protein n=1 Tax=Opisthorchis viverrini TaxID=6198 RepID=A0A074ZWW6_OPIVI|nr:hypothetical protein T265_02242 [Opisthorchis viverrini]KER31606.1 hypothetical protein T265_02242 [Opisthorchis viverrini]